MPRRPGSTLCEWKRNRRARCPRIPGQGPYALRGPCSAAVWGISKRKRGGGARTFVPQGRHPGSGQRRTYRPPCLTAGPTRSRTSSQDRGARPEVLRLPSRLPGPPRQRALRRFRRKATANHAPSTRPSGVAPGPLLAAQPARRPPPSASPHQPPPGDPHGQAEHDHMDGDRDRPQQARHQRCGDGCRAQAGPDDPSRAPMAQAPEPAAAERQRQSATSSPASCPIRTRHDPRSCRHRCVTDFRWHFGRGAPIFLPRWRKD